MQLNTSETPGNNPHLAARRKMVETDLIGRDIYDRNVIRSMLKVPREEFVGQEKKESAYEDHPIPIGQGQTISQPYIVALMLQYLGIKEGDKVLDIGTGSGYHAALMAEMGATVYTVEIVEELKERAGATFKRLGYKNIFLKRGDGYKGWPEEAPFEAINVACAPHHIPESLIEQMADGGRMILPIGNPMSGPQRLVLVKREGDEITRREVSYVSFVPMVKEQREEEI